jgi:hypothetical protein
LEELRGHVRAAVAAAAEPIQPGRPIWCSHEGCLTCTEPMRSAAELAMHELCAHGIQSAPTPHADAPARSQLLLVDDTMHLRSMRLACYRIAAEEGASFVCIHVTAKLGTALTRNAKRTGTACVPEPSLRKIFVEMEPPSPDAVYWERDVLHLSHTADDEVAPHEPGTDATPDSWDLESTAPGVRAGPRCSAGDVWHALLRHWARQPSPSSVEAARVAAAAEAAARTRVSQSETAASVTHAVDAALR